MEKSENILLSLIDYLVSHGYPKESLMIEWGIGKGIFVDLAVVDPATNKTIAIFELKRRRDTHSIDMGIRQLKKFSQVLGDASVPTYIVFGDENSNRFEIYHLEKYNAAEKGEYLTRVTTVPDFQFFYNRNIRKYLAKTENEREETYDIFRYVCWCISFGVFVLLLFDFINILSLSTERIILIAVIIGLIIIPFAAKLKILGFEFERFNKSKDN